MAQTIVLQRGSTTCSSTGNSPATLFTQSGGTATRVIINGLSFKNSANGNGSAAQLIVAQSGGTVWWPVAIKTVGQNGTASGFDFYPGISNMAGAQRATSAYTISSANILATTGTNWPCDTNVATYNVFTTDNQFSIITSSIQLEHCPQQFWIGPGDSVQMRIFNNSSGTATIGFSFTTITES